MNTTLLKTSLLAALALLPGIASAAPIPLTGTMVHNENFDSFGTSTIAWTNDTTLPGWYAQINNGTTANGPLQPTDGSAVLTGLLNCGTSGSLDRALGSKATSSGNFANIAYAVSFQNTSTSPIQFSKLTYTGELWRSNTTVAGLAEVYTVYYQVSPAAVTNIISGTSSGTPAPGAGFTALGAGADWTSPVITVPAPPAALDGNDPANRSTVSFSPASSIVVQPGQFLMIKWTDTNIGGTDGFQAIDDVSVEFTELSGSVSILASARTRSDSGTPLDNSDDTFGFTASITGSGSVSASWITTDVNPPAGNINVGPYGTPVVWTGFPIAAKTVTVFDSANGLFSSSVTVDPLLIIGSNNLITAGTPLLQEDAPYAGWVIDDAARTLTQNAQPAQADHVINSQVIDLSSTGFVQFVAQLNAISGTSSGFEGADGFALQLIIDGGTPISVLGDADKDSSGRLTGLDDLLGVGPELPGNDEPNVDRPFTFSYIIPESANTVQIRIIGNSNSGSETYVVSNIALNPPPPTVSATIAGPSVRDNKGTVDPADDEFSGTVNIVAVNLGASPGWHSDEAPPHVGLYSSPNPVTFGPYLVSGGAKAVVLTDDLAPLVSSSITIPLPPAAALTASAPTNILLIEHGPGTADDEVSFTTTLAVTNGGPSWTATGATPASGAYGTVSFTIPAPLLPSPVIVTVTDASYPTATADITVPIPVRYVIGQKNFGAGLSDVKSDLANNPSLEWVNDANLRTLTMTAGIANVDSLVVSEVINLSGTGVVFFTANLNAAETSVGSNFETTDRFKAELIIDGGTATEQIINLVSSYDTGDGAPAVGAAGGVNGPPNGYINGYQGIAVAPASAEDDYNNNLIRDEFNAAGEIADIAIDNDFPLSFTIPAAANTVQLKIYGAGAASSETFLVSDVLFSTTPLSSDTDGDGVSNDDENTMGTDPDNASDVLRLSQNSANPLQLDFPAETDRFYRVYVSDDTNGQEATHLTVWKDAGAPIIVGNTGSFSITVAPAEARRFYRLHVMRTDGPLNDGAWPATVP